MFEGHLIKKGNKKNIIIFFRNFSINVNYFNHKKHVFRLFKMTANESECSRLEQRSVIKILVARKSKPGENLQKVWYVWISIFLPKYVNKWAKYGFATTSLESMEWKHIDFPVKKKFRAQQLVTINLTMFLDIKSVLASLKKV